MKAHELTGAKLNWLIDFETTRRQRVVIGKTGPWKELLSGLPLGSVLWPLLLLHS